MLVNLTGRDVDALLWNAQPHESYEELKAAMSTPAFTPTELADLLDVLDVRLGLAQHAAHKGDTKERARAERLAALADKLRLA